VVLSMHARCPYEYQGIPTTHFVAELVARVPGLTMTLKGGSVLLERA